MGGGLAGDAYRPARPPPTGRFNVTAATVTQSLHRAAETWHHCLFAAEAAPTRSRPEGRSNKLRSNKRANRTR